MDITTLIGIIMGVTLILSAIWMRVQGFGLFFDIPSAMITFGGAFAATLVNYPLKQVLGVSKIVRKVFTQKEEDTLILIEELVVFAKKKSRLGVKELERDIKNLDNEFLKRGLRLVVDGADQDRITTELSTELTFIQERHKVGQEIFVTLGTYSPAFGMIGTIMGLIMMLANLEDQAQIAQGMALALLTTFYGALAAYLFFLPIAGKLKRRNAQEIFIKDVIIQGVLSLQSGEIPSIMEAKMKAYLAPTQRVSPGVSRVPEKPAPKPETAKK